MRLTFDHYAEKIQDSEISQIATGSGFTYASVGIDTRTAGHTMSMLFQILPSVKPGNALDVGCGCGQFTNSLCSRRANIVAIDPDPSLIPRWRELRANSSLRFCCMDGRALAFGDNAFPLVLERDALHHTSDWTQVIDEMVRVSSIHILIEEPIDDLRSVEKRNTFEAQCLLLELQKEVGFPHFQHLAVEDLISHVRTRASVVQTQTDRNDARISFEKIFASFNQFAVQSARQSYWCDRLEAFRSSLRGSELCEDDRILLVLTKNHARA